jgi:hypothetical protein
MGERSPWKTASLLGNNIWTMACTWLPKTSTLSMAVMQSFTVIIGPLEYQDIATQIITDLFPGITNGTRHSGSQASLGVLQM